MTSPFAKRLAAARDAAGFSGSEIAVWFGISKSTAESWLRGRNPHRYTERQLGPMLERLEALIQSRRRPKVLPIPVAVRQKDRANYVRRLLVQTSR